MTLNFYAQNIMSVIILHLKIDIQSSPINEIKDASN